MGRGAAPVRWRDVLVDDAVLRVMEVGDPEADPLLFLHGWGLSPRCYAEGLQGLAATGVRVVAPCLPGFGGSDGPALLGPHGALRRGVDLEAYAGRVGRLLDVLGLGAALPVAGHSFGGGVALQLATQRPEHVRALTLVSSVGGAASSRTGLTGASWWRWAAGALTELHPSSVASAAPSMLRAFVPNALRKPVTLALTARLALTASLADQAQELVARGLPVLFVWGDADRLVTPGRLGAVAGPVPAEVVRGRHGWLLNRPEELASLLGKALVVHAETDRRRRASAVAGLVPHPRRSPSTMAVVG